MRVSATRFVIICLASAFAFQFISNSLLGPEVRLFPLNGEWFQGMDSPIGWKSTLAAIIYPVKYVMVGPFSFLGTDPDPVPPILLVVFGLYWTVLALVAYYILKIATRKKQKK